MPQTLPGLESYGIDRNCCVRVAESGNVCLEIIVALAAIIALGVVLRSQSKGRLALGRVKLATTCSSLGAVPILLYGKRNWLPLCCRSKPPKEEKTALLKTAPPRKMTEKGGDALRASLMMEFIKSLLPEEQQKHFRGVPIPSQPPDSYDWGERLYILSQETDGCYACLFKANETGEYRAIVQLTKDSYSILRLGEPFKDAEVLSNITDHNAFLESEEAAELKKYIANL